MIFTDGSKLGNFGGCAYIVFDNGIKVDELCCRLCNTNVYMAEAVAINLAVDYIENCDDDRV